MHKEMSVNDIFINIISCGINDTPLDDDTKKLITEDVFEDLYELGEKHHITHIIGDILLKEKLVYDDFGILFRANIVSAINKTERICASLEKICSLFEENCIPFVPLKGSVLRGLYPKDWYRSSTDIDVLVKKDDLSKAEKLLTDILGCRIYKKGPHDISYIAGNNVNIELHFALAESDGHSVGKSYRLWNALRLDSVWDRIVPMEGYRYHSVLSDADFYLYHIVHMAKHFENGGCGVRSIIDLYLMDKKGMHDRNVKQVIEESKLHDFSDAMRKLSKVWFDNGATDDITRLTGDFVLSGGVFGNPENKAVFGTAGKGRAGYIISRIFMPLRLLKTVYPVLEKHKWLYPFCLALRWVRCISPDTNKRVIGELTTDTDTKDISVIIKKLGL